MVIVYCPAPGCTYRTEDLPAEVVVTLLNIHALEHSRPQIPASKLNRPTVDIGIDEETWNSFVRRWETFKLGSGISEDAAPTQLFQCASESLGDLLLKSDPRLTLRPTENVLMVMKSMAVIPVARGVNRAELFQMKQSNDEPIRTFAARVRGKAETCSFTTTTKCKCGHDVQAEYTEEVIRDVLLAGIADVDIRREALSMPAILEKTTNDVIAIIETREMARNATPTASVSAMSSYKRGKNTKPVLPKTTPCPSCAKPFVRFKEKPNGEVNRVPYKLCLDCWRANNRRHQSQKEGESEVKAISTEQQISQISALNNDREHPKTTIHIGLAGRTQTPMALVEVVADTGAMSNVWGLTDFEEAGFSVKDLHPSSVKIRYVNEQSMDIVGQFNSVIRGLTPTKDAIECMALVYVSKSVKGFYLSCETMRKLYIVDNEFPTIGSCKNANKDEKPYLNANKVNENSFSVRSISSGCAHPNNDTVTCECPQRKAVPSRPQALPFPATPANNENKTSMATGQEFQFHIQYVSPPCSSLHVGSTNGNPYRGIRNSQNM